MKRILAYGLIIMLALSCADIQEPEVHNDDSALDGWWYLAALSDTENMTSGDPQLFDEQYTYPTEPAHLCSMWIGRGIQNYPILE